MRPYDNKLLRLKRSTAELKKIDIAALKAFGEDVTITVGLERILWPCKFAVENTVLLTAATNVVQSFQSVNLIVISPRLGGL